MLMQTKILKAIWGSNTGFVFIPRRHSKTKQWDEGKAYAYPDEIDAVNARIKQTLAENVWDMYWCPIVFDKAKRLKENAPKTLGILWADLDEVNPRTLGALKPSVAWQSSDDRYQSLWLLDSQESTEEVESVNKSVTYHIDADKGGWDIGQVLRIPNTPNYKYDPTQEGKILWVEPRKFALSKVKLATQEQDAETKSPTYVLNDLLDKWSVPKRLQDVVLAEKAEGDRSERLWEIEVSLLEIGLPILTVVEIVQQSVWNKFKGRKNEREQLHSEVLKADEYVKSKAVSIPQQQEVDKWALSFEEFTSMRIDKPEWLIEGIWQDKTYGIIAGEPKTYKSVQATDMALSVASGSAYLGSFPVRRQGTVLYIQEENNEQTVQDRVFKIANHKGLLMSTRDGWQLPQDLPLYFSNNFGIDLTSQESRALLENTIKTLKPILIILDPLYMMLGKVDENSATEVSEVLRWLTYLRNTYGLSIVLCHHYNKGGSARGGQRVRGSSAFHAWVESALYVKATNELFTVDIEREFRAYPTMPEFTLKLKLGNPGELLYMPEIIGGEDIDAMLSIKSEELFEIMSAEGRLSESEITERLKLTPGHSKKLIKSLVDNNQIVKVTGGGRGVKTGYELVGGAASEV